MFPWLRAFRAPQEERVAVPDKVDTLTWLDSPHGQLTPKVLDILRNNNVKGTFFMQGCNVTAHPQVVRRMVNEGHEVGNHTWNHAYLSKVSREKAEDQLHGPMTIRTPVA